jgi:hypothetical protein
MPVALFPFDAFSSREPESTPDQVRGRLSLENALAGSDDDPGGASGGNALAGRVNAPVNADRRPNQKARDRFPARA